MSRTSLDIACDGCDATGYENFWRTVELPAYYRPGAVRRWSYEAGAASYDGDASIKVNQIYETLMNLADHVAFNGVTWDFRVMRDPGAAMGNRRIVYLLTRKE